MEGYSTEALSSCITCEDIENTEMFNVFVETEDAQLSAQIGNYIAEIAPKEITRVFNTGAVEVIDYAKCPSIRVPRKTCLYDRRSNNRRICLLFRHFS